MPSMLSSGLLGLALLTIAAADNCLRWTPWINADSSSGKGDFETIGFDNRREGGGVGRVTKSLARMGIICNNPVKIECRVAYKGIPWYKAGDKTKFPSRINCDTTGLACYNNRQADGRCANYEVRLLCWTECAQLQWTGWSNKDRPSGSCDCEHPGMADHPVRNGVACPDGQSPLDVDCRTTSGVSAALGPDPKVKCDVINGFSCYNHQQPSRRCQADYKVRYLCFKPQNHHGRKQLKRSSGGGGIIPSHSFF
nr:adult cement protein 11 [Chelonibia testudinaria]